MTADQLKRADGAMEKQRCCNTKWTYGGYRRACTKTAKVERDGKWYCGVHDPVARAEKAEARLEQWRTKAQADIKARAEKESAAAEQKRRADLYDELVEFVQEFLDDYQSDDGMRALKYYAGKAHTILAKCKGEKA